MRTVVLAFLLFPLASQAQYKCVENGHTSYTERPCGAQAKPVALPGDTPVTETEKRQAAESIKRQERVAQQLGAQRAVDDAALKRHAAALGEESRQKKARCASLLATAKDAETDSNLYHTASYKEDARKRQKEAEDRHFFECYNRHF